MKALLILALLVACETRVRRVRYEGLPPGERVCTWDIINKERGQCIVAEKRFRCFVNDTRDAIVVSCTPYRLWR